MPLNAGQGQVNIPEGFPGNDDSVLIAGSPHPRAVRNGWNNQFVRRPGDGAGSPSTSSADEVTVVIVPAEQRTVFDDQVASTTEDFFWRGRHVRKGSTAGDWTQWVGGSPRDNAKGPVRFARNLNVIDVSFKTTHKGSTASVTVDVFDPFFRVNAIEFREKNTSTGFPSTGNWSTSWDASTGIRDQDTNLRRTERLPILAKHNSALDVQIRYHNETGKELKFDPGPIVFDQDDIAEIVNLGGNLTTDDKAVVSALTDTDGEGNRIFVTAADGTTSGLSDPSTGTNDGIINLGAGKRGGAVDTTVAISVDSKSFVKARGENDAGELGPVAFAKGQQRRSIGSTDINDGAVIAQKLTEGARSWDYSGDVSANDHDTVSWSSGTLRLADGTEFTISSDNTGNMTTRTYIYFDTADTAADFKTTTSQNTALQNDHIIVAVADAAPSTIEDAFVLAAFGDMNVESGRIGANSIKAAKIDVASLDAISADIGEITAGHMQSSSDTSGIWLEGSSVAPTTTWTDFMNLTPASSRSGRDQDYLHFETSTGEAFTVDDNGNVDMFGGSFSIRATSGDRISVENSAGGTRGELYVTAGDRFEIDALVSDMTFLSRAGDIRFFPGGSQGSTGSIVMSVGSAKPEFRDTVRSATDVPAGIDEFWEVEFAGKPNDRYFIPIYST